MMQGLSRRAFVGLVAVAGGYAVSLAGPGAAQQPTPPRRIGVLLVALSAECKEAQALREGLQDAGYSEGRSMVIEWRYANGDYNQVPGFVADLVERKVELIVVDSTVATRTANVARPTLPIVMAIVADPVGSGLVASLAHPGGNVTGLSVMTTDLLAKRLQLLKEAIPRINRVAVLWNPDTPWHKRAIEDLKAAAPSFSIELTFVSARTDEELKSGFSGISRDHAQALYVVEDALFYTHRSTLLKLASKARLPTSWGQRTSVQAGALMSYGPNLSELFRRSAGYVDKILKGAKPGDLPIEQPTKFELIINLKTAKEFGISIPESILVRADEIIR
jgi:putative ABC transport system substrate-binding protein